MSDRRTEEDIRKLIIMNKKDEKGIFLDHHGKKLGGKIVGECTHPAELCLKSRRANERPKRI